MPKCLYCNKEFQQSSNGNKIYCTYRHGKEAHRLRYMREHIMSLSKKELEARKRILEHYGVRTNT